MEPVLDEASLVPCLDMTPVERIGALAEALSALDRRGVPRVLRSVRDAADRELRDGLGLRQWCFDRRTPRDAGRFVAQRLVKAPFLDGPDGLFAVVEGERAIQPSIGGVCSWGGGHVAMTNGLLVLLAGSTWPPMKPVVVRLDVLTEEGESSTEIPVDAVACAREVEALADTLVGRIVPDGPALVERLPVLFPRLDLGVLAMKQLRALNGSEPFFRQVLRHLQALDRSAEDWTPGTPFVPEGVSCSPESEATLKHGTYGPMRDFPTPEGFPHDRWTLHTKLTGGNGARLYYKVAEFTARIGTHAAVRSLRVAIGYVGPHLDTANFH